MSASHAPAADAVAFQLAAALESYNDDVERMVETWLDMELYRAVSEKIEEIRALSAYLPQLAVHWVELLIAHTELVHTLWRAQQAADRQAQEVQRVREHHAACIASLRKRCLHHLLRKRA